MHKLYVPVSLLNMYIHMYKYYKYYNIRSNQRERERERCKEASHFQYERRLSLKYYHVLVKVQYLIRSM